MGASVEQHYEVPAPIVDSVQIVAVSPQSAVDIAAAAEELTRLTAGGESMRRMLDVIAFLASEGVPIAYLTGLAGGTVSDVEGWADVLVGRSFATINERRDQLAIHPQVSQVLRDIRRRDGSAATVVGDAVGLLTAAAPGTGPEHREAWQPLGPQIIALRTNAVGTADPDTARSLMKLSATYMDHVAETIDLPRTVSQVSANYLRDVADLASTVHGLWELSASYLHHLTEAGDASRAVSLGVDVVTDAERLFDAEYPPAVQATEDLAAARTALDGP